MKKLTKIMIAGILDGSLVSGCGILADAHGGGNRGYHGDDRCMNHPAKCFIEVFITKTMENRKVKRWGPKEFPWTKYKKFNQKIWISKRTAISVNSEGNKVLPELHFQF